MPSPFARDRLSPAMQARYGMDRRPVGRWVAVGIVAIVFVAAFAWVATSLMRPTVDSRLLTWTVASPDRVDLVFDVTRHGGDDVVCVVRAQDADRIDVGYATVPVPAGDDRVTVDYAMRTLAPAYTTELLGCATGDGPRVPGPQFPPGVVPPAQPYSASG